MTRTECENHYIRLNEACRDVLETSFANDPNGRQAKAHSFVQDLNAWSRILTSRSEGEIFLRSIQSYQFSLLSLVQGEYRHSLMALRLTLELSLLSVYLSAHEKKLREWVVGEETIWWRDITDKKDGLLSESFCKVFNEPLSDYVLEHRSLARKTYDECSQYIHGNFSATQTLPNRIEFSQDVFDFWHDHADTIQLIVQFSLCLRYLADLSSQGKESIKEGVIDSVGHISPIRTQVSQ